MDKRVAYKYEDISLVPKFSKLSSRGGAKTSVKLGNTTFKLPIIPANMKSVINEQIAEYLSNNGYFYVMHRFGVDLYDFVLNANKKDWNTVSISVGVQTSDFELVRRVGALKAAGQVDYITIDIAHGYCSAMKNMMDYIQDHLPGTFIIAGNVATNHAVNELALWGADCVKVGIGQGHVCTTKDKTGFTYPMFTCVEECAKADVPIIADGGMKCNGDIAKALVAGAHMTMAGSLFSACEDSPGDVLYLGGKKRGKVYYGSASERNKGNRRHIEGVEKIIESNYMTYADKLAEIKEDMQSSISYAGGSTLNAFKKVEYIINY